MPMKRLGSIGNAPFDNVQVWEGMMRDRAATEKVNTWPPDFVPDLAQPDLAQNMRQAAGGTFLLMTSKDMQMTRADNDSVRGCP
jgi:hypothetical protein